MPPIISVTRSLADYLNDNWRIKGETQGRGYDYTNPASASETAAGGWWSGPSAGIEGSVLFFWTDFFVKYGWPPSFAGNPFVRFTYIEQTFDGANLPAEWLAAGMAPWVAGQEVGTAVRTNWTLNTGDCRVFIEVQGVETRRATALTPLFDLWTIPPDPFNNQKDNLIVVTVPDSLLVTIRIGIENVHPSCNAICSFPEFRVEAYAPPEPEPLPVPLGKPAPLVFAPCTARYIMDIAQEETGYRWNSVTEGTRHLNRFAMQLQSRCMAAWYGNEVEDFALVITGLTTPGNGWGDNWGEDWGGGGSLFEPAFVPFDRKLEAIWRVEALNTNDKWVLVNVVQPDDMRSADDPRLLIRDTGLELLDPVGVWIGNYTTIRLYATGLHAPVVLSSGVSLAPNVLIGPLFCRACELEMARFLAGQKNDALQAGAMARELRGVTANLMGQSRSQRFLETTRHVRR
jgi:hypothetical protein